jgi:hypothetical protein
VTVYLPWARSIALGWAALLAIAYLVERPLLYWAAPLFGPMWMATVHLGFDCATLAAAGWVAGRSNRAHAIPSALLFAATLCCWDFGATLALNVPWLVRLLWNTVHDSRYFDSLATGVETHVILFGCLIAGAMLSRPRAKPISIVEF